MELTIERGRRTTVDAEAVRALLTNHTVLGDPPSPTEIVCAVREDGRLAGVSWASPADMPLVGGRRLWLYDAALAPAAADHAAALLRATFGALESEFDGSPDAPAGLCALLDGAVRRRRPEAAWSDPPLVYAGYLADGRQVRVGYFANPLDPAPVSDIPDGYRIELFAEQDVVDAADVIALWRREGVLEVAEAERRVTEVEVVAIDASQRPVGISTAHLQRLDQLGALVWFVRIFVARGHRQSKLSRALALRVRDHLVARHLAGDGGGAIGLAYVIQSEVYKRHMPQPVTPATRYVLIGQNPQGDRLHVFYFSGALAPEPAPGSA